MAFLSLLNRLIRRDLVRSGVASRTVKLGGAEIHYYEAPGVGRAPPLLLVHGFGDSANTWYQVIGPLARTLGRVYALDLPGVGYSKLPPGRDHFDLEESIEIVRAFCNDVVREPCVLVGQSLGGAMVLRLGSREAHPWLGVAAIAPAGARMSEPEWNELRAAFDVPDRAAARALLQRIFNSPPVPLLLIEEDLRAVWRSTPVRKLMDSLRPEDFLAPHELDRILIPTLLLWGTDERLLPVTLLEYYRRYLPRARIEVVRGWTHAPQQEHPQGLVERLVPFVLGLSGDAETAVAR